jgi:hypothetical protein
VYILLGTDETTREEKRPYSGARGWLRARPDQGADQLPRRHRSPIWEIEHCHRVGIRSQRVRITVFGSKDSIGSLPPRSYWWASHPPIIIHMATGRGPSTAKTNSARAHRVGQFKFCPATWPSALANPLSTLINMASQAGGGAPRQDKVPIPRMDRRNEPPRKSTSGKQTRVSRACLSCRSRKIKCNGAQPTCQHCAENLTVCVYASSRKDRLKTSVAPLCCHQGTDIDTG